MYFMNIWHYCDNRGTWLYYRDGRIYIIALAYLIATSVVAGTSL